MNFELVLENLTTAFNAKNVSYALMGGFALHAAGYTRSTQDLDFLVDANALKDVDKIMASLSYRKVFSDDNVSHFEGAVAPLGTVDFLHASRKYTLAMLDRARIFSLFGGVVEVPIILPEDSIGLKVQAMTNDHSRYHQDMADITALLRANVNKLNMTLIEEYFDLFNRKEELLNILKELNDES